MVDKQNNPWCFLLNEKNETLLLFPLWQHFEKSYQTLLSFSSLLCLGDEGLSRQTIIDNLKIPLIRLLKKVFVYEFHLSQKKKSQLTFSEFFENLAEEINFNEFLNNYLIINNTVDAIFNNYNRYLIELLTRLQKDLKELNAIFKIEKYKLISIRLLGDSHCLGKRVAMLGFHYPTQKIKHLIYKPRDIKLEHRFNIFLDYINENCLVNPLKTIRMLSKNGYGWVEYVEQLKISKYSAQDYYFKFGVLLAVCHLLNGRDIHCENIIAAGEDPTIIDLECLFSPPLTQEDYDNWDFPSIFATLLIPPIQDQASRKHDFSALAKQSNELVIHQQIIKGDFHRIVYLEKSAIVIDVQKNGLSDLLTGKSIPAYLYSQTIVEGFNHYMHWVINNRERVREFINNHFNHLETRIVFCPTFKYQRILLELAHPKILVNYEGCNHFLNQMLGEKNEASKSISSHEIFDLLKGDIPYFSTITSGREVKNSQGEIIALKTQCSGLERVINKINTIDEAYLKLKNEQILHSLAT